MEQLIEIANFMGERQAELGTMLIQQQQAIAIEFQRRSREWDNINSHQNVKPLFAHAEDWGRVLGKVQRVGYHRHQAIREVGIWRIPMQQISGKKSWRRPDRQSQHEVARPSDFSDDGKSKCCGEAMLEKAWVARLEKAVHDAQTRTLAFSHQQCTSTLPQNIYAEKIPEKKTVAA